MSAPLNPLVYVCVTSAFNLPELEACLARRPSDIVLVVSDHGEFAAGAERLRKRLDEALPGVRIHLPQQQSGALPLGGDDVIECQTWVRAVLQPYLQSAQFAGKPRHLNFTGGTKAMTVALVLAGGWDALEYKARGRQQLQVVGLQAAESGLALLTERDALAVEDVAPITVAQLHNDHHEHVRPNPLFDRPESLELALALWQAQAQQDAALSGLFDLLEQVWSSERELAQHRQPRIAVALPAALSVEELDRWLARLADLQPKVLRRDGQMLEMPGNRPRPEDRDFVAWINANWLEQLCHHWLLQAGLAPQAVTLNLKIGLDASRSGSQREADLVLHNRGQTRLIEVKAGLPKGQPPAQLENQISSLGERFGHSLKALFISPRLRQQLESGQRWENFELRCQANRVRLCHDHASLLHFAGLAASPVATRSPARSR